MIRTGMGTTTQRSVSRHLASEGKLHEKPKNPLMKLHTAICRARPGAQITKRERYLHPTNGWKIRRKKNEQTSSRIPEVAAVPLAA